MTPPMLRRASATEIRADRATAIDPETLAQATAIVNDVRDRGTDALREYAERFDGLTPDDPLVLEREELEAARAELPADTLALLTRTADRIRRFADAQRESLQSVTFDIPGGSVGHTVHALQTAGCYAPGGRFPLLSSMLMTVVTARAAGVKNVWAASPRPTKSMQAAAAIAGADALLTCGGAHAIAALAFGVDPAPACDMIVGPGNRWVTAAKYVVSASVRIDMLAGPSELLIIADEAADAATIAADLLAQAEHDVDARAMLLTTSPAIAEEVDRELARQLETLPTRATAEAALANNSFVLFAKDLDEAAGLANRIAPEHLELHVADAERIVPRIHSCGCLFIGSRTAEVLGDYGAGPNHTLPTGGTARYSSGLSVMNFLRLQTWARTEADGPSPELVQDAAALARLERLEAHARSAERRAQPKPVRNLKSPSS